jgi:hypothetical protein
MSRYQGKSQPLRQRYLPLALVAVLLAVAVWQFYPQPAAVVPAPVLSEKPLVVAPASPTVSEPATQLATAEPSTDSITEAAADAGVDDLGEASTVEPLPALPSLDASDTAVQQALQPLPWPAKGLDLLVSDDMIRRFVVQVDNIAQGDLLVQPAIFVGMTQDFAVQNLKQGDKTQLRLDPKNYQRYEPYIRLLEAVPAEQLAPLYRTFYPLLQTAWQELGYNQGQFHDRLVQAIDVLVASPEVADGPALASTSVYYTFADPALESLPKAQRFMVRLGSKNQHRVKVVLASYRSILKPPAR